MRRILRLGKKSGENDADQNKRMKALTPLKQQVKKSFAVAKSLTQRRRISGVLKVCDEWQRGLDAGGKSRLHDGNGGKFHISTVQCVIAMNSK